MKLSYYSDVKSGKLQKNVSERIANDLHSFEGKRIEVTIQRLKSRRSVQQNRLWWLYVDIIAKEIGYTKEEMHEICKFKFLKREKVDEGSGEIFPYLASTTTLNKTDFANMVNELIQWASETFSIVLPMPEEQTDLNFNN